MLRGKHRRLVRSLSVMCVLATVAVACGDDDDSDGTGTTAAPAGPVTTAAPASAPSTEGSDTTAGSASTPSTADSDTTSGSASTDSDTTAGAGASSAEWDSIVAKAKEEGKVTIYSSQGLDQLNELASKFDEKYGITLEVVRGIDSELIPKVDVETDTGSRVADVFAFAGRQWGLDNAAKGIFVPPTGPSFDDPAYDRASLVSEDGTMFISTAAVFAYGWNTDRYSAGLDGYEGLLDPELAGGKIGVIDVHTSPVLVDFYQYLEAQLGEEFLTKLAAQEPKIYPSGLPIAQALTSGEIAAAAYVVPLVDEKEDGAPVDFGIPDEAWGARFNTVILKDSPHPNAAQVLADFIVSPDGQAALARNAASVLSDTPGALTSVDKVAEQDLSRLTPDVVTEYNAKWDALFK